MIVRDRYDCPTCKDTSCVVIDNSSFWESAICQSCDKVVASPRNASERNREYVISGYIREMLRYETPETYCVVISKMLAPDKWDEWDKKNRKK